MEKGSGSTAARDHEEMPYRKRKGSANAKRGQCDGWRSQPGGEGARGAEKNLDKLSLGGNIRNTPEGRL